MSIINNTWFVAFSASIISGLLVVWISRKIESRRSGKELRRRVDAANRDVLDSIRSLVGDKQVLSADTIDSMLSSAARKNELKKADLLTPEELAEEIVSQVIGDPFLSSKHKVEYSEFVTGMMASAVSQEYHAKRKANERELPEKGRRDISVILGAATFITVLLVIPITTLGSGTVTLNMENLRNFFLIIAIAIIIPTVCLWLVDFYRDLRELGKVRLEVSRSSSGRKTVPRSARGAAAGAASHHHQESRKGES
jgi:hypothetical protein